MTRNVIGVLNRVVIAAVGIGVAGSMPTTSAATLYWSGNGSTQGGAGTWDTTLARFGSSGSGPFTTVWNNTTNAGDTVIFGGSAGTATLGTDITVATIALNVGNGNPNIAEGTGPYTLTSSGSSLTLNIGGTSTSNRVISAAITGPIAVTVGGGFDGVLQFRAANTYSGTTTVNSGKTLMIGAGATTGSIGSSSSVANNGTFAINRSDDITQTVDFPVITGSGDFRKQSAGTVTLLSQNTFTGSTEVRAGTLQIGNGGTAGGLPNSSSINLTTNNTGVFAVNRSNSSFQGTNFPVITGIGGFSQLGTGATTLSLTNTYTGPTSVAAGSLIVSGAIGASDVTVASLAALGGTGTIGGNVSFASGSTFLFDPAGPLTVGGTVSFVDPAAFGVDDIIGLSNATAPGTYSLISGSVTTTGLANLGVANAYDLGSGVSAYFEQGSLNLVVVPEPVGGGSALVAITGVLVASRARRRRCEHRGE